MDGGHGRDQFINFCGVVVLRLEDYPRKLILLEISYLMVHVRRGHHVKRAIKFITMDPSVYAPHDMCISTRKYWWLLLHRDGNSFFILSCKVQV